MIKILKYSEVSSADIFSRAAITINVEEIVAEIIENVKRIRSKKLLSK